MSSREANRKSTELSAFEKSVEKHVDIPMYVNETLFCGYFMQLSMSAQFFSNFICAVVS